MITASSISPIARVRSLRLPKVCVAVIGKNPAEMVEKAEALSRDNDFVELRLDYLRDPALAMPKLKAFTDYHPHVRLIATCRREAGGGKFRGSLASQLEILMKAAAAGCQLIDLEIESASRCKPEQLERLRDRGALILSFHDFRGTKKLEQTLEELKEFPADFYKIVSTATTLHDNVVMMKFLEKESDQHSLVGMCMGNRGCAAVFWACARAARSLLPRFLRRRKPSRTDHCTGTARHLPDRASGHGHQGLRSGRRPGGAFLIARNHECGLPAGER